eukprot:g12638.t1 g12638   contig6:2324122-2324790(-)
MMQSDHSTGASNHSSTTSQPNNKNMTSPDHKVKQDLATLSEQLTLCQSMLHQAGSSIDNNESLLVVIGFLEACVPRMVELIEAAATGALQEDTFEECLVVNDRLTNVLADVDEDPRDRMPLSEAAAPSGEVEDYDDNVHETMGSLEIGDATTTASAVVAGAKTTGLDDDPFAGGVDLLAPTPAADPFSIMGDAEGGSKPSSGDGVQDDDDFDAFFKDRTSAS